MTALYLALFSKETSGATMREGLLHVQLTYKRKFEDLFPHHIHRSSERFLIRQIVQLPRHL